MQYILPSGQFRSRGEFFFAEWLKYHKIDFAYEPECFTIGDVLYLPDFILPKGNIIVEVKPMAFFDETWKIKLLADSLLAREVSFQAWIVEVRNQEPVPLACGFPSIDHISCQPCVEWTNYQQWAQCYSCRRFVPLVNNHPPCPFCSHIFWRLPPGQCPCQNCKNAA